ncbi:hypothetical protein FYT26_03005 [Campylobacter jejuni]|nr:hypothetical protein [Campylobacter jejuni]
MIKKSLDNLVIMALVFIMVGCSTAPKPKELDDNSALSICRRKNKISIWKNKTSIKVEILFFYKP